MGTAIAIDSRAIGSRSIDTLLAAQTLWHAGRSPAIAADGEPTGHGALDDLLPQGGWPRRALTELLLPAPFDLSTIPDAVLEAQQAAQRARLVDYEARLPR